MCASIEHPLPKPWASTLSCPPFVASILLKWLSTWEDNCEELGGFVPVQSQEQKVGSGKKSLYKVDALLHLKGVKWCLGKATRRPLFHSKFGRPHLQGLRLCTGALLCRNRVEPPIKQKLKATVQKETLDNCQFSALQQQFGVLCLSVHILLALSCMLIVSYFY